jgi:hypothetical protein
MIWLLISDELLISFSVYYHGSQSWFDSWTCSTNFSTDRFISLVSTTCIYDVDFYLPYVAYINLMKGILN